MINLSGLNYPCLEQISMVLKMLEPLKFDRNGLELQKSYKNVWFLQTEPSYDGSVCKNQTFFVALNTSSR